MLKIGINGACGRMGARLVAMVCEAPDMELAGAMEGDTHPAIGRDIGAALNGPDLGLAVSANLPDGLDVLIDFSAPESTVARSAECAGKGIAHVAGTTGLMPEQVAIIRKAAETVPCLLAPNMSLGVNLLFKVAPQIARALGDDYDIEIVETHHRFKKDSPSGTALRLAESIANEMGRDAEQDLVHGRRGRVGERTQREIGMHAVRAGDIVGEHTVTFACLGERIELTHRAHSRDTFCRGALAAARFLAGKPPGIYTMDDVLGLS